MYWQTKHVKRTAERAQQMRHFVGVGLLLLAMTSCGGQGSDSCSDANSISGYVTSFSQGLDNFSEDAYAKLRSESTKAYELAVDSVTNETVSEEATALAKKIALFVGAMEDVGWDVNRALEVSEAVSSAAALGSEASLHEANAIEAVVIEKCGLPSTYAPRPDGEVTLPMNSIPSPLATDPPINTINDTSELTVMGSVIASQFGLTVTDIEAECLGTALSSIYDVSAATANLAQYQSQFQRAFDGCGLVFTVPN